MSSIHYLSITTSKYFLGIWVYLDIKYLNVQLKYTSSKLFNLVYFNCSQSIFFLNNIVKCEGIYAYETYNIGEQNNYLMQIVLSLV